MCPLWSKIKKKKAIQYMLNCMGKQNGFDLSQVSDMFRRLKETTLLLRHSCIFGHDQTIFLKKQVRFYPN